MVNLNYSRISFVVIFIALTAVVIFSIITPIPVHAVNSFPMSLSVSPTSGNTPLTVSFNLNLGGTDYTNIDWNFGDGTPHTTNTLTTTHIYQKSGSFTGTVDVISKDYTSESQVFYVNVGSSSSNSNQTNANQQNSTTATITQMTVTTDQSSYNTGDSIVIKGTVTNPTSNKAIAVIVRDSLKNTVAIIQPPLSSTGTFSGILKANGPLWVQPGDYTVVAQYGRVANATTTFSFGRGNGEIIANPPVISQPASTQNNTNSSTNQPLPAQNPVPVKIPSWVKNIFIWYGRGSISDDELISALQFLIQQGIIKV